MPLDADTIRRLTEKPKRAPAVTKPAQGRRHKQHIRIASNYPKLAPNEFVGTTGERSLPCTSYGCGAPSCFTWLGAPVCNIHIVYTLVNELQRVGAVPAGTVKANGNGENGDDSYL